MRKVVLLLSKAELSSGSIRPQPPEGEGSLMHISSMTALTYGVAVDVFWAWAWLPAMVLNTKVQGVNVMLVGAISS